MKLRIKNGDKLVFCPDRYTTARGAVGRVIARTMKGKRGKRHLMAFIIKWFMYRHGTLEVRLRGKRRRKSNANIIDETTNRVYFRCDSSDEGLYSISYCHDCPFKLNHLVGPCPVLITKQWAKEKYAKKKANSK